MKRILFLILIFLTACSAAEPAPTSYFDASPPPQPDSVILTVDSTSEQIQRAMIESAAKWTTLQMDWHGHLVCCRWLSSSVSGADLDRSA